MRFLRTKYRSKLLKGVAVCAISEVDHLLVDPVAILGDIGVHSGNVLDATLDTPSDDAGLIENFSLARNLKIFCLV